MNERRIMKEISYLKVRAKTNLEKREVLLIIDRLSYLYKKLKEVKNGQ